MEELKVSPLVKSDGSVYEGDNAPVEHTQLRRLLGNRQIQLIAIGGSIGTGVFVSIGGGLAKGGPASLFIAFIVYCAMMGLLNNCIAEMSVYMPVSGGYIRLAGRWVDEALGFMVGWNFLLFELIGTPFEISALNLVLTYWRDDIPPAAVVAVAIALYVIINVVAVQWYGEAEFWLSSGKVLLFAILFSFTFITMVGGNPQHHAYGFRYWKHPGAFAEYITTDSLGRFEGFLGALWTAAFIIVGPEFVSMLGGEAKLPRRYLKIAFQTTYIRFGIFFIGSSLCVGILVAYNDTTLVSILGGAMSGSGTAAASPYVIAVANMKIGVLPHITNALLVTSIFSAGNAYVYNASRSLYGMALAGHAPSIFAKVTPSGVPIYSLVVAALFACMAFLNVTSSTTVILNWFINILTAAQIIDYIVICITYVFFYRACKAQGLDRSSLPYFGRFQPYSAWISGIFFTLVVFVYGYTVFLPGRWSVSAFFTYYTMVMVCPVLYIAWKIIRSTRIVNPLDADLQWEKPSIDAYEAAFEEIPKGFWEEILGMFGLKKLKVLHTNVV